MNVTSSRNIQPGYEPIAGYTLEQQIGQGGFGEVWRADAPGGLKKAVKFVFGATEENRGARELKSLERIKGVHHPFLLTLERFGIVDGQLVIVTELADGSLEDVYKRHQADGSCGIPRSKLLSLLNDAADALDYLHSSYQLQHLDIKPGNLLLVGGHVKVGDFGLLKDLRDADCSMVSGLTPIYAPPEVFDGRPSLHSDQYSLAVMYQELLTGKRPFSGRTIAQLATQHVHSAPNLEPLPPSDRPIIARALEKAPERRFANCKELIETLRQSPGRASISSIGMRADDRSSSPSGSNTANPNPCNSTSSGMSHATVEDLPQLQAEKSSTSPCVTGHALVIGLGGTGAEALGRLRSRVAEFSGESPLDLHAVLIDTDVRSIHAARQLESSPAVPPCSTIHTPLRTAQQYRDSGTTHLRSISRRWIYNIPRSGATEGMRPLGRLALVDHGPAVAAQLRQCVEQLAAASGQRTPRIYIVGSLGGGSGSGMFFDVVHLLRNLLDEVGLEQARILSLMATAALQGNPHHPLALHDAHAALVEMKHFTHAANGYPGDAGAGWPSVPAARTPLHDAYVVAAGPAGSRTPPPVETILEYAWADALGAGPLLQAARSQKSDADRCVVGVPSVRSVGVVPLRDALASAEEALTPALVRQLLLRWLGRPHEAKEAAAPLAERLSRRCGIVSSTDADKILNHVASDSSQRRTKILAHIRELPAETLSDPKAVENRLTASLSADMLTPEVEAILTPVMISVKRELAARLHDRRIDVTSAIQAVRLLVNQLQQSAGQRDASRDPQPHEAAHAGGEYMKTEPDAGQVLTEKQEIACDIGETILANLARQTASAHSSQLAERLAALAEQLEDVAACVAQTIQITLQEKANDEDSWAEMSQEIRCQLGPLMIQLHEQVAASRLIRPLTDATTLSSPNEMFAALMGEAQPLIEQVLSSPTASLEATSGSGSDVSVSATVHDSGPSGLPSVVLSRTSHQSGADTVLLRNNGDSDQKSISKTMSIEDSVQVARPPLLDCGGGQRLVLLVGCESQRERFEPRIRKAHPGSLSVSVVPGMDPLLIHEAQQIKLDDVLSRLAVLCGGNTQISSRLQSRSDIEWPT